MQVGTNISNVIDGNANKSRYDAEIKKILSDKQILAWILKYTTEEFKEYTIKKIISCIEGEPEVGTHPVSAGHYSQTIDGMNTEDTVPGEGKITYDIRFKASQHNGSTLGMIINVEAQNKSNPGYDIVTRGIFYCARMLSSQMGNDISAQEYDKLQKVYSIWICLSVPQKAEHSIVRYRMMREDLHGHAKVNSRYDLQELVMVYLGREETVANGTRLHGLLTTLLSDKLKPEQKKQILAQDYDIATTMELKGGIVRMCNLSDAIEEKGINKGIELGIKEQLRLLIEKKIQKGKPLEQIADELEETVEDIKPLYDEVVAALNK